MAKKVKPHNNIDNKMYKSYKEWAVNHYQQLEEQLFHDVVFPELIGTEKQIKWAERLRKHWTMDILAAGIEIDIVNCLLSSAKRAAFWIRERSIPTVELTQILVGIYTAIQEGKEEEIEDV